MRRCQIRTTCAISPKGEARTHEQHASSVSKAKLGHSNCMRHQSQRRSQNTWTACAISPNGESRTFKMCAWLDSKDTELHAPSVPRAKLGYTDRMHHRSQRRSQDTPAACAIGPKGEARINRLHAPSVPKVKLGYSDCLWTVLEWRGGVPNAYFRSIPLFHRILAENGGFSAQNCKFLIHLTIIASKFYMWG